MALLLPSLSFVSNHLEQPLFGYPQDDGLYFVSAKSIAEGNGHRIESFPGAPFQTKYPPLYPAYLALAWLLEPNFPGNLKIASVLQFLWLPPLFWLVLWHAKDWGIPAVWRWLMIAILGVNGYVLYLTASLLSELPGTVFLLWSLKMMRQADETPGNGSPAFWAGIVGGLAFLIRSASVCLLVAIPVYCWFRKDRKSAFGFALGMLPAFVWWTWWAKTHLVTSALLHFHGEGEPIASYYTDYVGYYLKTMEPGYLHLVLWRNIDGLLASWGNFLFPSFLGGSTGRIFSQVLAVAAIVGLVRMARNGLAIGYLGFSLLNCLILVVWHFIPNERLVFPMLPLVLAGFCTEMRLLVDAIQRKLRDPDKEQRYAARFLAGAGVAVALLVATMQWQLRFEFFPMFVETEKERFAQDLPAYQWMKLNLPDATSVQSGYDAVLYLKTGHPSAWNILPSKPYYQNDTEALLKYVMNWAKPAALVGLDYIYLTKADFRTDFSEEQKDKIAQGFRQAASVELVKSFPNGDLYRVVKSDSARDQKRTTSKVISSCCGAPAVN
jgi:hypothetical protein